MEVEKESLMKLKRLETQLETVIEKVNKEINQVNVEWLNLRSIVLEKMQEAQKQMSPANQEILKTRIQSQKISPPATNEYIDNDFRINHIDLELNPRVSTQIDEEFDSD